VNAYVASLLLILVTLLSASCSSRQPRYLMSDNNSPKDYVISVNNHTVYLEPVSTDSNVFKMRSDKTSAEKPAIYLTAIEDCSPRRTSLSGRLRQLFVGIAIDSFRVEDTPPLGSTRVSIGYSSARFEDKNLALSAVLLLPNDACPVDIVFWSTDLSGGLLRDSSFIVSLADQFISQLRRS
jgi:hypothetical protein